MYEVIGSRASRSMRVLWLMEELGLDYTHIPAKARSPEILQINPAGKIPTLRDGDAVITDSVAIMTYLTDKHGALTHPAGTLMRARQDGITQRINDELDSPLWSEGKKRFFAPKELIPETLTDFLHWDYGRGIAGFEEALAGEYLMGNTLMLPDILLVHCLGWAERFGFPAPGPKLAAYMERATARPAFQRAAACA